MRPQPHSLFVMAALLILCGMAMADIPSVVNCQGKVTDIAGVAVPDGTYTMRFQIYDSGPCGTPFWDSGAHLISVVAREPERCRRRAE